MILGIVRRFDQVDLKHFQFKDPAPDELAGATPELLADLHDLAKKFGIKNEYRRVCQFTMKSPKEISISASIRPNNYSMVIIGSGGTTSSGADIISLVSGYVVVWDCSCSVVDMEVFISEADEVAVERGLIDPETGKRLPLPRRATEPSKMSVDQVFSQRGSVMPVLPGQNAEEMRQSFDQPDKLAVVATGFGIGQALCHIRDLEYIKKKEEFSLGVLAQRGLTSIEQITDLSWQRIMELREEIDRLWREQKGG